MPPQEPTSENCEFIISKKRRSHDMYLICQVGSVCLNKKKCFHSSKTELKINNLIQINIVVLLFNHKIWFKLK